MLACTPCHGARGQGTQDDYFPRLAGKPYFASQDVPYPPSDTAPASGAVVARGQKLATQGDAARWIPACVGCHNPNFTGMEPGVPALLGLRVNYITAQLGGWRYGTRTAKAPDCMQVVAGRLSEDDVTALAAYLSGLPAPLKPRPLAAGSLVPPLACGSLAPTQVSSNAAQTSASPHSASPTATVISQGQYLARAGDCIACHTNPGDKLFSGSRPMPTPFGTLLIQHHAGP
jgi:cytochrome c553